MSASDDIEVGGRVEALTLNGGAVGGGGLSKLWLVIHHALEWVELLVGVRNYQVLVTRLVE